MAFAETFTKYLIETGALRFSITGYALDDGCVTPYYFDSGVLCTGEASQKLAQAFARTITAKELGFDVIFGPANKGTPIAITTTVALGGNIGWAFNQKTATIEKIIGTNLQDKRVLVVDNALTSGQTLAQAIQLVSRKGGVVTACVVAFDRQEKGTGIEYAAARQIQEGYETPVYSIAKLDDLVSVLEEKAGRDETMAANLQRIRDYRAKHGAV